MLNSNKLHGVALVVAITISSCLFLRLGIAQDQVVDGAAAAMRNGVVKNACTDEVFLELTDFEYDKCLVYLGDTAEECWDLMGPYIPNILIEGDKSDEQDSKARTITVIFALDRCIRATAIMDQGRQAKNRRFDSEDKAGGDLRNEGGEADDAISTWEDVLGITNTEFRQHIEFLDKITEAMIDNEYRYVDQDESRGTYLFELGSDEPLDLNSDVLRHWTELLVRAGVESVYRATDSIVFVKDFSANTRSHYFEVQYTTYFEPELPECVPDLSRIPCGSCEVDSSERYRAVLSWRSIDIETGGDETDPGGQAELMKCWRDGMSRLGFSID